jgi:hypothetical protein
VQAVTFQDVRDRIITTYRDEIKLHNQRECEFQHLEALISDLQRNTRQAEAAKEEAQKEHETQLGAQAKTIKHQQDDVEALARNIQQKQNEGAEAQE